MALNFDRGGKLADFGKDQTLSKSIKINGYGIPILMTSGRDLVVGMTRKKTRIVMCKILSALARAMLISSIYSLLSSRASS